MTEPVPKKEKVFFPNLDGLRFLSFFSVFLFHVYSALFYKYHPSLLSLGLTKFLFQNGEIGVNFFFVLSGFLITYLLIEEKKLTGRIHVGNFYIRRILRIWPLFYLCLFFGFFIYPVIQKMTGGELFPIAHPWTYFVFLNNFDFMNYGASAALIVLWSVAIEEQFYLFWPLILVTVSTRWYQYVFFFIIAGSFLFRVLHYDEIRVLQYHTVSVVGDMAFGGLLAYYCIFHKGFKNAIARLPKWSIAGIYLMSLIFYLFRKEIFVGYFMPFERLFIAAAFGMIILEQNFSKNSLFKMSNWKRVSKMGVYTYGLYCLHMISLKLTEQGIRMIGFDIRKTYTCILVGLLALFVSIAMAFISYRYFETRFLRLKNRFAFIVR
jgi:peptidoglycan/LPS O-acetylase OafA/YrhL